MPTAGPFSVEEIANAIGAEIRGDATLLLKSIVSLDKAEDDDLSFLDNPKYKVQALATKAGAVIVREGDVKHLPESTTFLIMRNPYVGFAKAMQKFHPIVVPKAGISNQAIVSGSAEIDPTARLEPGVVVYPNAKIGANSHIGANTVVGAGVIIEKSCYIAPNVTLNNCKIGNNCLVQSGVRIGQDGFGFAQDGAEIIKIPQIGGVKIGDDVEIGANTTIDRGALGDTIIGDNAKIDCQVQIAHNAKIGMGCRVVAQSGIAGSSKVGNGVVIGGQSGIAGHVEIADFVMVAGRSGVTKSVKESKMVVAGFPARPITQWRKIEALLSRMAKAGRVRPVETKTDPNLEKENPSEQKS